MKKLLSLLFLFTLIIPVMSFAKDGERLENRGEKMEVRFERMSKWEDRMEHRADQIEKIKERLASTTASTSPKKIEKLNEKLEKREDKFSEAKDRLLNRGLKVVEVLGKITEKIQSRINIIKDRGLDMTAAQAKLDEANNKLDDLTDASDVLAALLLNDTATTTPSLDEVKTAQETVRTLAKETHSLLVATIKEITKVLPQKEDDSNSTSTASSTDEN